ncbi:MAG: hypothetical protein WBD27_13515, partial [Pyrinomonadaceae bacterium]
LTKNISILRKILSDCDAGNSFIETIPKRGYRFVAEVTKSDHEKEHEQRRAKPSGSNVIKSLPAALPKSRKTDSGTHVIVNLADWRKLEEHTETKPEPLPAAVNDADAEQLLVEPTNAFQACQLARYHFNQMTPPDVMKSHALLDEAVRLDPDYAPAHSALTQQWVQEVVTGFQEPAEAYSKARTSLRRAFDLDPTSAEYYTAAGFVNLLSDWDFAGAEQNLSLALDINPHHAFANTCLGQVFMFQCQPDKAEPYLRLGAELDPTNLSNHHLLPISHFLARRYEDAIAEYDKMFALYPHFMIADLMRCWSLEQTGRAAEAVHAYEKILREPYGTVAHRWIGYALALAGDEERALETVAKLDAESREHYISPTHQAVIYAALDDADRAFNCLEMGIAHRDPWMLWTIADPRYDNLRSDPRFDELVSRINAKKESSTMTEAGDSVSETFVNLINAEPSPLVRFGPNVPDESHRVVSKMLRKNKSTAETSGINAPWYKRWPVIAAIAVLLMGMVGAGLYWFRPDAAAGQPQIRTLAVLPLKSLDPNDNALGFGIADSVIRRISQTGEMTVRPASSVRQYLTEDADAITAAKQLTVDAVLDGTIQRAGDRLRISVNLLKGDGTSLWTDSFDTQLTDVFAVQDTISQQVASRLKMHLKDTNTARLSKRSTSNPIAFEYYTKGIYSYDQRFYGRDAKDQNDATIELFKKAVEADPNYALAHASLANAYAFQAVFIVPEEQERWLSLANDAITLAEIIDPQLPETHLARSQVLFSDLSGYQAAAAIREILAAQRLDSSIGHRDLGGLYNHIGLEDLAEREFQRALEIDPTSQILVGEYRSYYMLLHRPDEFLAVSQKYFPEDPSPSLYYMMKGDLVTAKQRIDEFAAKNENRPSPLSTSFLLALKGEKKGSEKLVAKVISDINESDRRNTAYHHLTYNIACVYAINGNVPESMKWLRDSAEKGNPSYTLFARDPFLDKIRQSPEFIEFMAELKLEYDKYRSEFH